MKKTGRKQLANLQFWHAPKIEKSEPHPRAEMQSWRWLVGEQKKLSNMEEFIINLNLALNLLTENNDTAIIHNLYQTKNKLEICQNIDPEIKPIIELIDNATIQIEEASRSLQQNVDLNDIIHCDL